MLAIAKFEIHKLPKQVTLLTNSYYPRSTVLKLKHTILMFQVDSDKEKEKKSGEEETAEVKKEAEATEAAAAGEKDKDTAAAGNKKSAETPTDRLIKDGQLQSAATVGLRHFWDLFMPWEMTPFNHFESER